MPEAAAQQAEAYRIARRPDRHRGLTNGYRAELIERGLGADIESIADYAQQIRESLTDDVIAKRLEAIGAPVHGSNIAVVRTHLIRATASACSRVQRVFDDDIVDAADPIAALMADLGPPDEAVRRLTAPAEPAGTSTAAPTGDRLFQVYDARPFSAVIGDVLDDLKAEGIWKGDLKQQRRIIQTFAWITGDKPLDAYTHLDAAAFKKGVQQVPKKFDYGSLTAGAMSRPLRRGDC